jgi:hypothetical protein
LSARSVVHVRGTSLDADRAEIEVRPNAGTTPCGTTRLIVGVGDADDGEFPMAARRGSRR